MGDSRGADLVRAGSGRARSSLASTCSRLLSRLSLGTTGGRALLCVGWGLWAAKEAALPPYLQLVRGALGPFAMCPPACSRLPDLHALDFLPYLLSTSPRPALHQVLGHLPSTSGPPSLDPRRPATMCARSCSRLFNLPTLDFLPALDIHLWFSSLAVGIGIETVLSYL